MQRTAAHNPVANCRNHRFNLWHPGAGAIAAHKVRSSIRGWHHTCGITEASDIECWGSGVPGAPGERLSAPEGKFTTLAIGWRNSCALRPNGRAVCWRQPDVQPWTAKRLQLREAFGGVSFERPVELFSLPSGRLAVVEQEGTIATYPDEPNASPPQMMLDLTDKVECCEDESGMFSTALDPKFEEFPFLYVYYRTLSEHAYGKNMPGMVGRLARFRVVDEQAVRDSELTILEAPLPNRFHYGGAIRFGADGMLYLGIGENFSSDKAQALDGMLGKIIRIDVRGATPEMPYRAPSDNPFVDDPDALPEIWAYGLRNPWRMAFAPDGRLFVADVGSGSIRRQEEVSLVAAGVNLGCPLCEGKFCEDGIDADAVGFTAPIFTYERGEGCAIIGGATVAWLNNGFVIGDYCSRRIRLLEEDEHGGWRTHMLAQADRKLSSFSIDAEGVIYVLAHGKPIMRLQPEESDEFDE